VAAVVVAPAAQRGGSTGTQQQNCGDLVILEQFVLYFQHKIFGIVKIADWLGYVV
jgi:hypothetical protein